MRISRDESLVKQNQVAGVAQLVEQRIRNAKVGSSNPLTGTIWCHTLTDINLDTQ